MAEAEATETTAAETTAEETIERSIITENIETGTEEKTAETATETAETKESGVPEQYELTMPEGWSLDAEGLAALTPIMKELKASNKQVQAVADVYVRRMAAARESQLAADRKTIAEWQKEIREDPEIGGASLNENLAGVSKILRKYAGDEFVEFLDRSNLGNYPPFVRAMVKMSKDLSDDRLITGGRGSGGGGDPIKEAADLIFGKLE